MLITRKLGLGAVVEVQIRVYTLTTPRQWKFKKNSHDIIFRDPSLTHFTKFNELGTYKYKREKRAGFWNRVFNFLSARSSTNLLDSVCHLKIRLFISNCVIVLQPF